MRATRVSFILGVSLLALLGLSGSPAAQSTLSVEAFTERLERAIEVTELGASAPSASRMEEVRNTLGLPADVEIGGRTVLLPPDPFLEDLSGERAIEFQRAGAHLRGIEDRLRDALDREVPGAELVQSSLQRAYSEGIQIRPGLFERIRRALQELMASILYRVVNFVGPSSVLAWAVIVGLVVGAVLLVRRARLVPERILPGLGGARAPDAKVDWVLRARAALAAGDLREAIRALYLALVTTLSGRGLLADAPALTAGECRSAVRRSRPSLYPLVARATESYERVVYGGASPNEQDVETLLQAEAGARTA